jgi:hypothetical protein
MTKRSPEAILVIAIAPGGTLLSFLTETDRDELIAPLPDASPQRVPLCNDCVTIEKDADGADVSVDHLKTIEHREHSLRGRQIEYCGAPLELHDVADDRDTCNVRGHGPLRRSQQVGALNRMTEWSLPFNVRMKRHVAEIARCEATEIQFNHADDFVAHNAPFSQESRSGITRLTHYAAAADLSDSAIRRFGDQRFSD